MFAKIKRPYAVAYQLRLFVKPNYPAVAMRRVNYTPEMRRSRVQHNTNYTACN